MPLNPPDIKELRAIVDWVNLTEDVRTLSIKFGEVELFISRDRGAVPAAPVAAAAPLPPPAPAAAAAPAPVTAPAAAPEPSSPAAPAASGHTPAADEVVVPAPMVGTFYASPKPGAPAFVNVGDRVSPGTVLCIVEVMKLMNNVEAQVNGTISQILVSNEQAVAYGQPMMVIKKDA